MPSNEDKETLEALRKEAQEAEAKLLGSGGVKLRGVSLGKSEHSGTDAPRGTLKMPEGMSLSQIRAWKEARDKELARLAAEKKST